MKNFVVNTFYKQRQDFERDAALHDKKFSMPKDVKEWKDLPYKNDGEKAHRMDVFRPKKQRGRNTSCYHQCTRRRTFVREQRV